MLIQANWNFLFSGGNWRALESFLRFYPDYLSLWEGMPFWSALFSQSLL